ncbi:MAG: 5-formyltetrahydrofolate cyclo-ligase, partial [Firmicutes bacterium]|nr:5-formyltetrahydrofolate cyclo-ligase [Bacillota bacterium]
MSKSELRKDVIRERGALTPAAVAQKSALIQERIEGLAEYRQARTVMIYVDFRNEVATGGLIQAAMAAGKRVAVPVTDISNKKLTPSLL